MLISLADLHFQTGGPVEELYQALEDLEKDVIDKQAAEV